MITPRIPGSEEVATQSSCPLFKVPEIERRLQERGVNSAEAAMLVDHLFATAVRTELDNSSRLVRAGLVRGTG